MPPPGAHLPDTTAAEHLARIDARLNEIEQRQAFAGGSGTAGVSGSGPGGGSSGGASGGTSGTADALPAEAAAVAGEAYRELRKLESAGGPELEVSPKGDSAVQVAPNAVIALGDGDVSRSASIDTAPTNVKQTTGEVEAPGAASGLGELELFEAQLMDLENNVLTVEGALRSSQLTPVQARDHLAQLEARLQRVQCDGIDSVTIGTDEARRKRKELTQKIECLQSRLDSIFAFIAKS